MSMRDDVRGAPVLGPSLFVKGSDPEDVVDVTVGVDSAMQGFSAPRANFLVHFLRGDDRAGVDHDEAVVCIKDAAVTKVGQERHTLGDLSEMTTLAEGAGLLTRFFAAPQAIGEFNNVHGGLLVGVGRLRFGRVGG